ncbi:MAG: FGGY-family carbohydrate kinase, partial [Anaerolineales bacterium]
MKKKFLIGVDLGTSGTKSALYTVDGKLIADSSTEVKLYYPKPGVVEQETQDFYDSAALTVRNCIKDSGIDPEEIAAIAFDSQMAGVGSIDENYLPATRFDSWLDMRCEPYIKWMSQEAGDKITQLTGCPPTCDHGPKMLWWKNEDPDAYRKIEKFVMPAAYVAGRLANLEPQQAFIDYTFIHFSGFSDAKTGTWSKDLCDQFGIDIEKLPKIVPPYEIIGETSEIGSEDFGLAPGTIIAAGAGDTAANALGAGIVEVGRLFDVAGTASVLAACTDTYISDIKNKALLTMRSVIPGLWNPLAYIGGGGIALRWVRDHIFHATDKHKGDLMDAYDQMTAIAAEVPPGSDGLLFSPHFGGRICPSNPEMRGAWIGLSWSHGQKHLIRAMLESVAFEYAYYLKTMCDLLPDQKFFEARAMGGGAKSEVWNQIKADVLNVTYYRLQGHEFGTWGAAMI